MVAARKQQVTRAKRTPKKPSAAAEPNAAEKGDEDQSPRRARHRTSGTRRAMLDSAAELFAVRGFAGTNLRDVADALGMSRPGLYYHFPSKEKLLEALIEEVTLSGERELIDMVQHADSDPEEALRQVMRSGTRWVLDNAVLFKVLDRAESELTPEMRERHDRSKKTILEQFTEIIRRGVEVGKFRPVDPHIAALTITGMRNWSAWWFTPNGRLSAQEVANLVADMAVRSLLRPDAHRSRSNRVSDVLRILQEDVAHLSQLIEN